MLVNANFEIFLINFQVIMVSFSNFQVLWALKLSPIVMGSVSMLTKKEES